MSIQRIDQGALRCLVLQNPASCRLFFDVVWEFAVLVLINSKLGINRLDLKLLVNSRHLLTLNLLWPGLTANLLALLLSSLHESPLVQLHLVD